MKREETEAAGMSGATGEDNGGGVKEVYHALKREIRGRARVEEERTGRRRLWGGGRVRKRCNTENKPKGNFIN